MLTVIATPTKGLSIFSPYYTLANTSAMQLMPNKLHGSLASLKSFNGLERAGLCQSLL